MLLHKLWHSGKLTAMQPGMVMSTAAEFKHKRLGGVA